MVRGRLRISPFFALSILALAAWLVPSRLLPREARFILQEQRRRSIQSFLLATSDYHRARAARIYRAAQRAMGGGPDMRVVAARDEYFGEDAWWRNRQSRKTVFFEWSKTLATAIGR